MDNEIKVDDKTTFSVSQIQTWLTCRFRWYLQYQLGIKPRFDKPYIALGSCVHKALAFALVGKSELEGIDAWRKDVLSKNLIEEDEEAVDNIAAQAAIVSARTLTYLDLGHRWETVCNGDGVPLVEIYFLLPFRGIVNWAFRGYIDWLVRDIETGYIWLWDHKVRGSFQAESAEEYNFQMSIYQAILQMLGAPPTMGSILFQIKSAIPRRPKVNKNGSISKAAVLTDWATYSKVIEEEGQDINDYLEMKQKLDSVEWFRLTRAYRSQVEIDTMFATVTECALDLMQPRKPIQFMRNLGFMTCNGCKVRDYCLADLRGHDTDFLLKTSFMKRGDPNTRWQAPEMENDDEFTATI